MSVEKSALQSAVANDEAEKKVLDQAKEFDNELGDLLSSSLSYVSTKHAGRSFKDILPLLKNIYPTKEGFAYQIYYYDKVNKSVCDQACVADVRDFFDVIGSQNLGDLEQKYKDIKRRVPSYIYNPENVVFIVSHKINCVSGEVKLIQDLLGFSLWEVYNTDNQLYILDKREQEKKAIAEIANRLKAQKDER